MYDHEYRAVTAARYRCTFLSVNVCTGTIVLYEGLQSRRNVKTVIMYTSLHSGETLPMGLPST